MKKLLFFAAALLVLVACDNQGNNAPERTPFKKGQQVTLTVGSANQGSQAPARTMSGNKGGNQINFTWEEGDKILVNVGDATAEFTLSSEPGLNEGEFTGTMPADGSTFDIQYPINVPNITKQVYTTEKPIPADSMLFRATDCTLDAEATLIAQYAMVQLNLYGTDMTVGMIIFKNITAEPAVSDTLICTGGKTIDATSAEATPFYMVVPAGTYQFEAEIWDNATTPAKICSFATSAAKTFTAGKCLNMPAKYVPTYVDLGLSVKWATCNLGATTPEGYGDYFAWGETSPKESYYWNTYKWCIYTENPKDINLTKYFVRYVSTVITNVHGEVDNKDTLEPEDDAAHVNWGGNWRMPTEAEWDELTNTENCTWVWQENYNSTGVKGSLVTSKKNGNSIFLPASGERSESELKMDGEDGFYWSSSLHENYADWAFYLLFNPLDEDGSVLMSSNQKQFRDYGLSVRPVCK